MRNKQSRERDWVPFMDRALELAREAQKLGDVPVGALVVDVDGKIIAEAKNEREFRSDPTAHAEILALKVASKKIENWRLSGCTLVVTLEPCVMCSGASMLARLDRVVYGASDLRAGGMSSVYKIHEDRRLNHEILSVGGVLEESCQQLLLEFFRSRREEGHR